MARDGNGDYSRVEGPYINGQVADADEMNAELDDFADAVSDSVNIAGTKAMAANLAMGGHKVTGLAAGASNGDAVRYEQLTGLSATYQPLDATLTAFAALAWVSGNALVQFTAADTVSLTLTPSVSSVTANNGSGATTPAGTFRNTTDNAAVEALRIGGDRATPAANDTVYITFELSDSAGNQDDMARIRCLAFDVTAATEDAQLEFWVISNATLAARMIMNATVLRPNANDGMALGTATVGWADLFGASGFTLNFNNGNFIATHANGTATFEATTGGFVSKLTQVASVSGTLVAATHRNRQLLVTGDITLPNSTMAAGDWHVLTGDASNRTINRGSGVTMYVNGTDSATATLTAHTTGGAVWETASIVHLTGAGIF